MLRAHSNSFSVSKNQLLTPSVLAKKAFLSVCRLTHRQMQTQIFSMSIVVLIQQEMSCQCGPKSLGYDFWFALAIHDSVPGGSQPQKKWNAERAVPKKATTVLWDNISLDCYKRKKTDTIKLEQCYKTGVLSPYLNPKFIFLVLFLNSSRLPKYLVRIAAGFVLGEIMGPATFAGGFDSWMTKYVSFCRMQVVGHFCSPTPQFLSQDLMSVCI